MVPRTPERCMPSYLLALLSLPFIFHATSSVTFLNTNLIWLFLNFKPTANIQFPLHNGQFPPCLHPNILFLCFLQLLLSTTDQITHPHPQNCGFFSGLCAFLCMCCCLFPDFPLSSEMLKCLNILAAQFRSYLLCKAFLTLQSCTAHFCTHVLCTPLNHHIYIFTHLSSNLKVMCVSSSIPLSILTPSTSRDTRQVLHKHRMNAEVRFPSLTSMAARGIHCLQILMLIFSLQWEAWYVQVLNNNLSQKPVSSPERDIPRLFPTANL